MTASAGPRPFFLILPEEFIEIPIGEVTETGFQLLSSRIATLFNIDETDLGAVGGAITLGAAGAAAAAGGATYLAAGIYRSSESERPIMALVSCFVMPSDHDSTQTAITGLLEIHESRAEGVVRTLQLDAGPAVLVETSETVQLRMGQPDTDEYELVKHSITAWIPDPLGNGIVALTVSSNNPEDWIHVRELALGIFDAFLWQSADYGADH